MNDPNVDLVREWMKNDTTRWFLAKLAWHLNEIDTARGVESGDEYKARSLAIQIIENALGDIWEAGELTKLQKKISQEEDSIIKKLENIPQEY